MISKKSLVVGLAISALMAGLGTAQAQTTSTGTGTSTSNSGSQSNSSSGAIGLNNSGNAANQSGNVNSNTNANSGSRSGSRSVSGSTATGNASRVDTGAYSGLSITNNGTNPGQNGTTDPGGRPYGTWNGGDVTVRSAPTVYAPPVSGGNPCTLAVSGGVSVIGWGAAAGGTFVDSDCAMRQKIAMIHNAGYQAAAKELMCQDRDTYFAFRTAGQPCAYRANFEGGAAPVAQAPTAQPLQPTALPPAPAPAASPPPPAPVAQRVLVRCNPAKGIVDNCYSG